MGITNTMLPILLVIISVNIKVISGAETSDDKFINSLPEPQRREFLAKVQDRIKKELPEIKAPNINGSTDLYWQQLENQGKFIQNILRTEIDGLQRRNSNNDLAYRRSNLEAPDDSHIDLTLHSKKEKRRAEIESDGKSTKTVLTDDKTQAPDMIPVVVQYDSESAKPEKVTSDSPKQTSDPTVNKTNEITWIVKSTTKSLDISKSSVDANKTRRINYIDTTLPNPGDVAPKRTGLNDSANAVEGLATNNVNASENHDSEKSPTAVKTTKKVINSNMEPKNNSYPENVAAKFNVTSQIKNEEDNGTKGNTVLATDDDVNYTTQSYVDAQSNYEDALTQSSFSKTINEGSSSTPDNVYTVSDIVVDSTVKYDVDTYTTIKVRNETQEYINTHNVGNNTTQYEVDISTMLDDVHETVHVINNSSNLKSNVTAANDVYAALGDNSATKKSIDNNTSLILNNVSDSISAVHSTTEVTNNPKKNAANEHITMVADSSEGKIAFKSNYVSTDAGNVKLNSDYLATTKAFSKNLSNNIIHSTIMHNLFGSSLLDKATHTDKNDTEKNYIASVTTNDIVGSTLFGDVNAETDDYYHTTNANYANSLTDSVPSSTFIGGVNAPNDGNGEIVTVNIINEITTDNLVGVTKLGHVDPDARDKYQSPTVQSIHTVTDTPFASTVLGDVSAEKYGQQSTTTHTINVVTENILGSTQLGNVNPEANKVRGIDDQDVTLKGNNTPLKIFDNFEVILNSLHNNSTNKKHKLDTDHKTNIIDSSQQKLNVNSKDKENILEHFALRIKEDENTYRVYVVDAKKNVGDVTTPDPLNAMLKYLRGLKNETPDPRNKEDVESQPHYVRVYNYDPENAYFNADDHQSPSGNTDIQKTGKDNPIIVKAAETRSKSTKLDIHLSSPFNASKPRININDVKDKGTSASNNNDIVNVDELIFGDQIPDFINDNTRTVEPDDNTPFEKPLKRGLNKIRQVLFNVQNRGNEEKNNDHVGDKYSNQRQVETKYENYQTAISDLQNKHAPKTYKEKQEADVSPTEGIDNIVAQVKMLVDHAKKSETSASYNTKDSIGDTRNPVGNSVNSLKNSHYPDIQLVIETLQNIEDVNQKRVNAKSRFKIADNRDGEHLKKDLSSKQNGWYDDRYTPDFIAEDINVKAYEESKPIILHDKYLELHVNTLKDFVDKDDASLRVYDWLGTTVLIQAGIEKLQHIVDMKLYHKRLHPLDRQLLDFVIDLHLTAEEVTENDEEDTYYRRFSFPKPKPKKGKSHRTFQKMLDDIKKGKTRKRSGHDVNDLEDFLKGLKRALNDLHTAIKQISLVTKYRSQHWFRDIKNVYLKSAGAKEYLELLLHLTAARLVELLDVSAKRMDSEDEDFIRKNRAWIERIGVEFMMVLNICKELERL